MLGQEGAGARAVCGRGGARHRTTPISGAGSGNPPTSKNVAAMSSIMPSFSTIHVASSFTRLLEPVSRSRRCVRTDKDMGGARGGKVSGDPFGAPLSCSFFAA